MRLLREQVLVENRDLQVRNLQTAEQRLHLRRQVAVLQDEFEQHADEIDGVLVGAGDVRPCRRRKACAACSSSSCLICCTACAASAA